MRPLERPLFFSLLLALVACEPEAERSPPERGDGLGRSFQVLEVIDGDTLRLAGGIRLRYLGVDSPERDTPGFRESLDANRELVGGRKLELGAATETYDRYGRLLAIPYVRGERPRDRLCVSEELLRRGLSWIYLKDPDSLPPGILADYLAAQREALGAKRGVWSRLEETAPPVSQLVTTRLRIHRRGCRHLRSARPRPVRRLEEPLEEGKSPCRSCRPLRLD